MASVKLLITPKALLAIIFICSMLSCTKPIPLDNIIGTYIGDNYYFDAFELKQNGVALIKTNGSTITETYSYLDKKVCFSSGYIGTAYYNGDCIQFSEYNGQVANSDYYDGDNDGFDDDDPNTPATVDDFDYYDFIKQ